MKKKDDEKNFFCCAIIYYYYCISIYGIYDIYGITITIFTTLRFYDLRLIHDAEFSVIREF